MAMYVTASLSIQRGSDIVTAVCVGSGQARGSVLWRYSHAPRLSGHEARRPRIDLPRELHEAFALVVEAGSRGKHTMELSSL